MSVEINVGDLVVFNNIECYILLHKIYKEGLFSLRIIPIEKPILAKVIVSHRDDDFDNGYVILQKENIIKGDNQTYLISLSTLLYSPSTIINDVKINDTGKYPNKWAELTADNNQKSPEILTKYTYGYLNVARPRYDRLVKKFISHRKRVYLWVCNMWHNFTG